MTIIDMNAFSNEQLESIIEDAKCTIKSREIETVSDKAVPIIKNMEYFTDKGYEILVRTSFDVTFSIDPCDYLITPQGIMFEVFSEF